MDKREKTKCEKKRCEKNKSKKKMRNLCADVSLSDTHDNNKLSLWTARCCSNARNPTNQDLARFDYANNCCKCRPVHACDQHCTALATLQEQDLNGDLGYDLQRDRNSYMNKTEFSPFAEYSGVRSDNGYYGIGGRWQASSPERRFSADRPRNPNNVSTSSKTR